MLCRKREEKAKKEEDMAAVGKSLRTSTMLDPISLEVLESSLLLDRALKQLSLFREWWHGIWLIVDNSKHPCRRLRDFTDIGNWTINSLSNLLETKWFVQYRYLDGKDNTIIKNPFYNMSKEELAVKLDLLEA